MKDIFTFPLGDVVRRMDPLAIYRGLYRVRPDFDQLWNQLRTQAQWDKMTLEERVSVGQEALDAEEALVEVSRSVFSLPGDINAEDYVSEAAALEVLVSFFVWAEQKKTTNASSPTLPAGSDPKP